MKTVIEMVREASDPDKVDPWRDGFWVLTQEELERFAELVRADEREAVEGLLKEYDMVNSTFAKDFRARSNT